jgi:GTP cyclohydrolase III
VTGQRQPAGELTIGIVGPHDLVERIMLSGTAQAGGGPAAASGHPAVTTPPPAANASPAGPGRRLIAAAYRSEQEAADKVLRLGPGIDACLFASQVPYEYARRAGSLRVPGTYVPLSGSALFAALLRASRELGRDLSRVSVDVLSRADIEDAFGELGVPAGGVHVREDVANTATLAAFHERLFRREETTVAFTCLQSVAQRLAAADVPVRALRPTSSAIRSALRTATLLAAGRRLEEAQLAVAVVDVPTLRDTSRRASPRHAREELRLTVHRFLVQEAQRMHATVSPVSDHCFLVTATRGSLAAATDGFRVPPFSERARTELGIAVEVGIGMGRTAQDAEAHAQAALARSHVAAGARGFALDREGLALVPSPRHPAAPAADPVRPRGLETLSRLADKLAGSDSALVVDAETAGRVLGVTARTARRLLHGLVEEGLAWPLPPSRAPQPGRPRQFYRLVTEKLERRAAR